MARRVCNVPGCPTLTDTPRCTAHQQQAERRKGTAAQRGYDHQHRTRFRAVVLARDPICVLCHIAVATVADHHPKDRRQLVAEGLDPNDPTHGRGLCHTCHGKETALLQPGGWNADHSG